MSVVRINELSPEDRAIEITARKQELRSSQALFGPKYTIKLHPLLHADMPQFPCDVMIPATHEKELREVVEAIGGYFYGETGLGDGIPYSAETSTVLSDNRPQEVALFDSRRVRATFPVAAGAAQLIQEDGRWWLDWIWIHPYERGSACRRHRESLMDLAWADLEEAYGSAFKVQTPVTAAMRAFLTKREVDRSRWTTRSD